MELHEEIIELLKKKSQEDCEYINPNFLSSLTELIYVYYDVENDEVDRWVRNMFEM